MIMGTEHKCLHKADFITYSFLFKSGANTFMGDKLFICLIFICLIFCLPNIFKGFLSAFCLPWIERNLIGAIFIQYLW